MVAEKVAPSTVAACPSPTSPSQRCEPGHSSVGPTAASTATRGTNTHRPYGGATLPPPPSPCPSRSHSHHQPAERPPKCGPSACHCCGSAPGRLTTTLTSHASSRRWLEDITRGAELSSRMAFTAGRQGPSAARAASTGKVPAQPSTSRRKSKRDRPRPPTSAKRQSASPPTLSPAAAAAPSNCATAAPTSARAPSSCDGVRTGVSPEISSPAARKASARRWAVLGAQSSAPSGVGAGSSGSGQPAVATTSTATLSTANSSAARSASRSARTNSASAASWSSAPAA
mmetsp:Transcript_25194/g.64877  ORF Transcript_25194/g.64877 Transcript_25194/m.64877 type:complete len:286 (+) Transcript_25194:486-1343(+)